MLFVNNLSNVLHLILNTGAHCTKESMIRSANKAAQTVLALFAKHTATPFVSIVGTICSEVGCNAFFKMFFIFFNDILMKK